MWLLIDEFIRPDASMQHQGRGFHITLGRRYADLSQSQQELKDRLVSNPVIRGCRHEMVQSIFGFF